MLTKENQANTNSYLNLIDFLTEVFHMPIS